MKHIVRYILFYLSACLFPIAYIFPVYAWWMIFVFPVLFIFAMHNHRITFMQGALWGLIAFALQFSGLFYAITRMAEGSLIIRAIPPIILLAYFSLFTGTVLWTCSMLIMKYTSYASARRCLGFTVLFWLLFFLIDYVVLFPFGPIEGYFLLHPVVPLAQHPYMLRLLPYVGKSIMLFFVFLLPCSMSFFLLHSSALLLFSTIIASLFWIYSIMLAPQQPDPPAWLHNIAAISAIYPTQYPAISAVRDTSDVMKTILQNNPEVNVIVFPESSFHYDTLHHMQAVADAWSDAHLQKPVTVVAGAFRWDDTAYRNCAFCFDNGILKAWHDKRHAMLLTESIPSWCHFDWLINMHCKEEPEIQPSTSPRPPFELTDDLVVTPYICSELYFSHHADDGHDDIPILFLGNDVWLEGSNTHYIADLMRLGATCRACAWQRDIIYITQLYAEFVSKEGHTVPLS